MQGKSSDLARHAIPSIRKHRIILTFGKSNPKRPFENSRIPVSAVSSQSTWGPPPGRPIVPRHSSSALKHYGVAGAPATGVLPPPSVRPQHLPPSNGIPPLFVAPTQVAPTVVAYPTPAQVVPPASSSGWPMVTPPMHPGPRLPVPGTGVFLPPSGSGHSPPQQLPSSSHSEDASATSETESQPENPKIIEDKPSSQNGSSQRVATETMEIKPDCNGSLDSGPAASGNPNFNHMKKKTSIKHLAINAAAKV